MEGKLKFVLVLFVVSEASPQPQPDEGQRPPFENFPPHHYHGRHLERHRPLPDRPLNIDLPFFNGDNPPAHRRFDNQREHPRFGLTSFNKQRIQPHPTTTGPEGDDNAAPKKTQFLEQPNGKINNDNDNLPGVQKTLKASANIILARLSEGLKKDFMHVQNIAKNSLKGNNTSNRINFLKKIEESNTSTLLTTTTPKTVDATRGNNKNDSAETKLDSINNIDSNLINQIFGSADDESSTTESTTEYETTTWDEFNRIGAPPAVVASLLG